MTKSAPADQLWFQNSLVTIQVSMSDGQDGISVLEHRVPYGFSPPLHVHRSEDEVLHILEGEFRVRIQDKERRLGAGEVLFTPKGIPHTYRVESTQGGRCQTVTTRGDFERFVRAVSRPAERPELPPQAGPPSTAAIEALRGAAAKYGIDLVGPPLKSTEGPPGTSSQKARINPSEEAIHIGPIGIRFLLTRDDTNGNLSVFEVCVPAGQKLAAPPHKNDAYEEVLYGIEGVLTWTVNGTPIEVGPGQALCIPRGAVHRFDNFGTEDVKQLCLISPPVMGPAYFREAAEAIGAAAGGPPDRAKMEEVFHRHGMTLAAPPPAAPPVEKVAS